MRPSIFARVSVSACQPLTTIRTPCRHKDRKLDEISDRLHNVPSLVCGQFGINW